MDKRDRTAAIVDGILRLTITSGAIAAGLVIPNLLIGLEKPLDVFWKQLDKRERERELRRVVSYMKTKSYLRGDYEHGLRLTTKGRKRLAKIEFEDLEIEKPQTWDKKWRLVFFDIPESERASRVHFINKLKRLGFYKLQQSAWIHPFPCREIIEKVSDFYDVDIYISYVEVTYIDNQQKLKNRFKNLL
ncbi:MAG: hypothetical protein Q7R60_00810 [bacterium]|nr:hypothetical protein [bacterium]